MQENEFVVTYTLWKSHDEQPIFGKWQKIAECVHKTDVWLLVTHNSAFAAMCVYDIIIILVIIHSYHTKISTIHIHMLYCDIYSLPKSHIWKHMLTSTFEIYFKQKWSNPLKTHGWTYYFYDVILATYGITVPCGYFSTITILYRVEKYSLFKTINRLAEVYANTR